MILLKKKILSVFGDGIIRGTGNDRQALEREAFNASVD